MSAKPLNEDRIIEELQTLPGWTYRDNELRKTFELKDFRAAISFIVRMAFHAEELNHHPNLSNVYNRVDIALTTHDAGDRVTEKDIRLARAIEDFSWV